MQAFVIKDDRLYTFDFSTQELQVPQTFPAVQKMLQSVKFLTPKTNASTATNASSLTPTTTATTAEDKNYIEFSKNAIICKLSEAQGLPIKEACDKFNNPQQKQQAANFELKRLGNETIRQCTPYVKHQSDNFTFNGPDATTTQTCYNALAFIVFSCDSQNATICSDQRVIDFSKNYYDALNRPYDKTAWKIVSEKQHQ